MSAIAARSCSMSRRFFRSSQPSLVPSGCSFKTRSQRKKVVVRTCSPLGLRLCRKRISGIAPASNNNAEGRRQNMTHATLLTWRSVCKTNSSNGTPVVVRR